MSNFWQRAITGTIFVVVLVGAILLGGWYMHVTFGLITALGLFEFYSLFENSDSKPQKIIGTFAGTSLYFLALFSWYFGQPFGTAFLVVAVSVILISGFAELFRKQIKPFENIALTVTGIVYVMIPFLLLNFLGFSFSLFELKMNYWPVLTIFILIWCNDTFAYLTGRLIGKHKLFERISPKKTWEGFIGGVFFAVIAGVLIAYFNDENYLKLIVYGIIAGVVGTFGDLVESMLKRSLNVKDSGSILPGHGGILDRFDAVLFVVPIIFVLDRFIF